MIQLSLDNDTISLVNLLQGGVDDKTINEAMLMTNLRRIIHRPEMNFEANKGRSLKMNYYW